MHHHRKNIWFFRTSSLCISRMLVQYEPRAKQNYLLWMSIQIHILHICKRFYAKERGKIWIFDIIDKKVKENGKWKMNLMCLLLLSTTEIGIYSVNRLVFQLFHWLSTNKLFDFSAGGASLHCQLSFFYRKLMEIFSSKKLLYHIHSNSYRIELLLYRIW